MFRKFLNRRRTEVQAELGRGIPSFPAKEKPTEAGDDPKWMTISGTFSSVMVGRTHFGLPYWMHETSKPAAAVEKGNAHLEYKVDEKSYSPFTQYTAAAGILSGIRAGYPALQIKAFSKVKDKSRSV